MKKNITINMFGSLYAIDEDAYALLKSYLENMRRYFSKQEGGDENADDVEHRVAQLMEELKQSGKEAGDIDDVQNIIHRIGDPEQMDSGEPAEPSDAAGTDSEETDSGTGATSSTAARVADGLRRLRARAPPPAPPPAGPPGCAAAGSTAMRTTRCWAACFRGFATTSAAPTRCRGASPWCCSASSVSPR